MTTEEAILKIEQAWIEEERLCKLEVKEALRPKGILGWLGFTTATG